jgi:hypothetical protein
VDRGRDDTNRTLLRSDESVEEVEELGRSIGVNGVTCDGPKQKAPAVQLKGLRGRKSRDQLISIWPPFWGRRNGEGWSGAKIT